MQTIRLTYQPGLGAACVVKFTDATGAVLGAAGGYQLAEVAPGVYQTAAIPNEVAGDGLGVALEVNGVQEATGFVWMGGTDGYVGLVDVPPPVDVSSITADLVAALSGGTVTVQSAVTAVGTLPELVIGDDYADGSPHGPLVWKFVLPDFVIAGGSCWFGGSRAGTAWLVEGQLSATPDVVGGVTATFTLAGSDTADMRPGEAEWSVELRTAAGLEATKVRGTTELRKKYT